MSQNKGPERPQSHITGDTALSAFNFHRPQEWAINDAKSDYGWDIRVSIKTEQVLCEDFLVQLKGSEKPEYIDNNSAIAHSLKTTTVNWLRIKTIPTMLCICDTGKSTKPVYWVWLNESLKEIEKANPNWLHQQTVTVRVPTTQTIDESSKTQIETYVRDFYLRLNINKEIGQVIGPAFQIEKQQVREAFAREPHEFIQQQIIPPLADAGIVEATGEAFSTDDQRRFRIIKEASLALNNFHDVEAEAVLDQLSNEIDVASDGIKGRYFNNRGVLALHKNDLSAAGLFFQKAHDMRPEEPKYAINLLHVEYELAPKGSSGSKQLPPDWEDALEAVLSKSPDFTNGLRLKAYWIGQLKGASLAEDLLRKKTIWNEEPVQNAIMLAEIYLHEGNLEKAINILREIENLGSKLDGIYWSVYGHALFRKSLGIRETESERTTIEGAGPRNMDMGSMKKACYCYSKAFQWFESKGMPHLAEPTILNYSTCLGLLGRCAESEQICRSYLGQHTESYEVKNGLAEALFHQKKYVESIPLMQVVYKAQPTSSLVFKNLVLCLFFAEEYEELISLLRERQTNGFVNLDEESLSRSLAAIAFFEIGQMKESQNQIDYLMSKSEFAVEAAITRATIEQKRGVPKEEALNIFRLALKEQPNSLRLLSHLALNLAPATHENSAEIAAYLRKIYEQRQLIPEEFSLLGTALMILGKPEEAEQIYREAFVRYPSELRFLYDRAYALMETGDAESAFNVLQVYIKHGEKKYSVLRNMAIIATDTNRLDEAINLFQMALGKTRDEKEIGEIHCQLYELKKYRRDNPKDILRHVVEFGKSIHGDPELEARYLMMFFITPFIPDKDRDTEVEQWVNDFQRRLQDFSEKHPDHSALRTLKIPKGLTDEKMRTHFLTQLSEIMLPHYLASVPLQLIMRNNPFPLASRSQFLPGYYSIFEYWDQCVNSDEFGSGIHIFSNINSLGEEEKIVERASRVCIDLTALLTLADLELLDMLSNSFDQIIIARSTKIMIDSSLFGIRNAHPLAEKIEKWRLANRSKIRVRNLSASNIDDIEESKKGIHDTLARKKFTLDIALGCGVGTTLLLAQKLQLPLYSDESIVRHWAKTEYQVPAFSTLAFLKKLLAHRQLTYNQYVFLNSKLIEKNFRTIRIEVPFLNFRLKELITLKKESSKLPTSDDLVNDHILGVFLRQFGETTVNPDALANLAINWWLSVLFDQTIPISVLTECMQYPIYALSMRTSGGVLFGISVAERLAKAAALCGAFLWHCYRKKCKYTNDAWNNVKISCSRIFPDEKEQERILFELIPKVLITIIKKDESLTDTQKTSCLVDLPHSFESDDRIKFEKYLIQHKPKFFK